MSLTGNLEDLPLLDILQIVSFSKKTGYLTIRTEPGEGAIVFSKGFVVSSFTWDSPLPDPRAATLAPDKRAALARNRISIALEQLIRLREGQFSFSLTHEPPRVIGNRDIGLETLPGGINPQELLLDLARGIDEDRRDSTAALEASFAATPDDFVEDVEVAADPAVSEYMRDVPPRPPDERPGEPEASTGSSATLPMVPVGLPPLTSEEAVLAPPPPAPPGKPPDTILLVDDEDDVRQTLAERFAEAGYRVVEAQDPDSAAKTAGRLSKEGTSFLVVTDLGMPSSGGSSFQGGFEVVKRLWKMHLEPPILLMTESLSPALQARARQMGIGSVVFKPGLSKLDPRQFAADLRAFASKISTDVLPRLTTPGHGKVRAAQAPASEAPRAADASKQLTLLLKRLLELRETGDATRISSVVMKVAREFFERGILFLVKNEEVRGLGAFGRGPREVNINLLVRDVVIPLGEPSVFLDAVSGCRTFVGPLPSDRWAQNLMVKIGRFKSGEVALLPLLAHRETIALLFGDNPETGRALSSLEALEVFIHHAGVALENAFLQRKILALQQRE